ncbi:zf-TFIIB domain-containing protein [Puerhibacterium sp. TATVAM-FAB25]|uniref:TFIIB-type zinc ribbon-containing protein n=1 Tax=Puerhibacterium sp. TATVAM-FAB25 TaxID=3093699 RepID=UPI00397B2480
MQCPSCQSVLVMSERKGVEIDYCPQCRGVWLDRGELDKIIDRALDAEIAAEVRGAAGPAEPSVVPGAPVSPLPPVPPSYGDRDDYRRYDDKRYDDKRYDERRYDDRRYDERRYDKRYDDRYRRDDEYRRRKKKDSFLGDLFDF